MSINKMIGQNVQTQQHVQTQGLQSQQPAVQAGQAATIQEAAEDARNANQFETGTISQAAQGDIPSPNAQVTKPNVTPMSLSQLMLGNTPEIAINPFPDTGDGIGVGQTTPEIAINPFPDTTGQTGGVNAQTTTPEIAINPFPDITGQTGGGIGAGQTEPGINAQTTTPEIAINPFPDTTGQTTTPEIAINPFPDTGNGIGVGQTTTPEIAINPFPDTMGQTGGGIGVGQTGQTGPVATPSTELSPATFDKFMSSFQQAVATNQVEWSADALPTDMQFDRIPLYQEPGADTYAYTALVPKGANPNEVGRIFIERSGGFAGMTTYSNAIDLE